MASIILTKVGFSCSEDGHFAYCTSEPRRANHHIVQLLQQRRCVEDFQQVRGISFICSSFAQRLEHTACAASDSIITPAPQAFFLLLQDESFLCAALRPLGSSDPAEASSPLISASGAQTELSITSASPRPSLLGVLLRVDIIQDALLAELLGRLVVEAATNAFEEEEQIGSVSNSAVPLYKLLLREIRWLEFIADPKAMTGRLLELLDAGEGGAKLQSELIAYIPEIICDDFEHEVAERLVQLLQSNGQDLVVPILDALAHMGLHGEAQRSALSEVLDRLESADPDSMPALVRFLLQSTPRDTKSIKELVMRLRGTLNLTPDESSDDFDAFEGSSTTRHASVVSTAALLLETFKNGLRLREDIVASYLKALTDSRGSQSHYAIDLWFLFCIHGIPQFRAKVERILKAKAGSGCINEMHLADAIKGRSGALDSIFGTMCSLAAGLVRSTSVRQGSSRSARRFGGNMYLVMFLQFTDGFHRQEIVTSLCGHVGSGAGHEADTALGVLDDLVSPSISSNDLQQTDGGVQRQLDFGAKTSACNTLVAMPSRKLRVHALRPFVIFLKGMLDFLDKISEDNARTLFRAYFILGDEEIDTELTGDNGEQREERASILGDVGPVAATAVDDVHIAIRKFLALSSTRMRRLGIIGAVAFMAQRGSPQRVPRDCEAGLAAAAAEQETVMEEATECDSGVENDSLNNYSEFITLPVNPQVLKEIQDTFDIAIESCIRDSKLLSFFLEEVTAAIESKRDDIHPTIVGTVLTERFISHFEEIFTKDKEPGQTGSNTAAERLEATINDSFSTSSSSSASSLIPITMWGDLDARQEEGNIYLPVIDLAVSATSCPQTAAIEYMGALLRLVAACEISRVGQAEAIDAVLGCPIALSNVQELLKYETNERCDFRQLPASARYAACAAHKNAIDVIRELINVFVTSTDDEYRWKIGKRLEGVCELTDELVDMVQHTPDYAASLGIGSSSSVQPNSDGKLPSASKSAGNEVSINENDADKENLNGPDDELGEHHEDADETGDEDDETREDENDNLGRSKGAEAAARKAGKGKAQANGRKKSASHLSKSSVSKKTKVEKSITKDEIKNLLTQSMRPLRREVATVLAWSPLQWYQADVNGDSVARGSINFQGINLNVACLLLGDLKNFLTSTIAPEPDPFANPFFAAKSAKNNGVKGGLLSPTKIQSALNTSGCGRSGLGILDGVDLIAAYLDQGVFLAFHRLLCRLESALVDDEEDEENSPRSQENRASSNNDIGDEYCWPCLRLMLDCISVLCRSDDLVKSSSGRSHLLRIFHELGGGPWNPATACGEESCVPIFIEVFSRLSRFIGATKSLTIAVDMLHVLEDITSAAMNITEEIIVDTFGQNFLKESYSSFRIKFY